MKMHCNLNEGYFADMVLTIWHCINTCVRKVHRPHCGPFARTEITSASGMHSPNLYVSLFNYCEILLLIFKTLNARKSKNDLLCKFVCMWGSLTYLFMQAFDLKICKLFSNECILNRINYVHQINRVNRSSVYTINNNVGKTLVCPNYIGIVGLYSIYYVWLIICKLIITITIIMIIIIGKP